MIKTACSSVGPDRDQLIAEILPMVWRGIQKLRDYHHPGTCNTSAAAVLKFVRGQISDLDGCNPCCLDDLVDGLLKATRTIEQRPEPIRNLPGFITVVIGNYVTDMLRHQSAEAGGMARPDRSDGLPGAVVRALPPEVDAWLLASMLKDAARRAPVPASGWNLDLFVAQCLEHHPQMTLNQARVAVMSGIEQVLRTARTVAGTEWVERYIEQPRARRRARYQAVPILSECRLDDEYGTQLAAREEDPATRAVRSDLRRGFLDRLPAYGPVDAVRLTLAGLATAQIGAGLPTRDANGYAMTVVAEMLTVAIGVDAVTHRLNWLPDIGQARQLLERGLRVEPGESAAIPDTFLRGVIKILRPLESADRAARALSA